jgi:hypothetical protein
MAEFSLHFASLTNFGLAKLKAASRERKRPQPFERP